MNSKQKTLVLEIVRLIAASALQPKRKQPARKGPTPAASMRSMRPVAMLKRA